MRQAMERTGKRWICIAAGILASVWMLVGVGFVSHAETTVTVIPDSATVRSGAGTDKGAVGSVSAGTQLTVAGQTTGSDGQVWYQVTVNGATGYIRSDLVNDSGVEQATVAAADSNTETAATVTDSSHSSGTISSDSVNIRKGPASTDAAVGNVKAGTVVEITGEAIGADGKTWYQVSADGKTGFIRSDLISAGEGSADAGGGEEAAVEGQEGETLDGESPEAGEAVPIAETGESTGSTTISNVISTRILPGDVDLEDMTVDESLLAEWASGQYYILYTEDEEGIHDWYLYSMNDGQFQKITNLMENQEEEEGASGFGGSPLLLIVMAVVILLLIIISVVLGIKLREYQAYYDDDDDYDDDEEDEDDDYDEDEDEDDDEEDEDDEDDDEDDGRVSHRRWRPKNFLSRRSDDYEEDEDDEDEEEDEDEEDEDGEGYLDDDDFEFEFLNLDGKKDIP